MSLKCPIQIPPEVKIMCTGGKYIIACSTELLLSKLLIIPPPPQIVIIFIRRFPARDKLIWQ